MTETNEENLDPPAVDPPKNDGGAQAAVSSESPNADAPAVDPPKNDGGTS